MSGVIPNVKRFEVPPTETMEETRDELALHQEDWVGASEEVGTTTPLVSSASVPEQTLAQQTPPAERVVLLLQDTETPPALPT